MALCQQEWDRLQEIQEEMQELREEAKHIVLRSENYLAYERARAYWLSYLENALDEANSPLMPCTMGDTLLALEPDMSDEEDDEDLEEEEEEKDVFNNEDEEEEEGSE